MASYVLDLIAIPDFAAGAMENWGLITYRLTSLLYDEHKSSDSNKQWVAVVVAHELAHQVCACFLKNDVKPFIWKSTGAAVIEFCFMCFLLVLAFFLFLIICGQRAVYVSSLC